MPCELQPWGEPCFQLFIAFPKTGGIDLIAVTQDGMPCSCGVDEVGKAFRGKHAFMGENHASFRKRTGRGSPPGAPPVPRGARLLGCIFRFYVKFATGGKKVGHFILQTLLASPRAMGSLGEGRVPGGRVLWEFCGLKGEGRRGVGGAGTRLETQGCQLDPRPPGELEL